MRDHATIALAMRGVRKRFGATTALDGVELEVREGEIHALLGENGAGKSTLMRVLAGAVSADSGELSLFGAPYAPRGPHEARLAGVAMIHQELALAPHLTVAENIALGVEPLRCRGRWRAMGAMVGGVLDRASMRATASRALEAVGASRLPVDRRVCDLGLAERQLVELARAVASTCRVLVLDEPTSALTRRDAERLIGVVRRLRDRGCAVVWISHVLEEVRSVCDRFTVLRDGRTVGCGAVGEASDQRIVALMAGRPLSALVPRSRRVPGEVVLRVEALAGGHMPREATLELRRGEVLGIAGLVGAGRSELLRTIFGLEPVRGGRVRVLDVKRPAPRRCWRAGAGMVAEERRREGLLLGRSIAENLTLSRLGSLVSRVRDEAEARRWIEVLGVRCRDPAQSVAELSGGNQQKIVVARLLRHPCDVLLLDEPARGVDVAARATIFQLVDDAAVGRDGRPPRAILMTSSALEELMGACDRIAVMRRGRLGPARPVAEWSEHALLAEAIGVEEAA